ncbi:MAG: ribonuclease catalytic domain-containing protein [Thermodesulfobacteriota bacterium]
MAAIGRIVEYIEHGKFYCAVVLEESARRLRILNQHGRETNLPEARAIHQSRVALPQGLSRDEMQVRLKETDQHRQALMAAVDLAEVWELAKENADSLFAPTFLASLVFGEEPDDDQVAAFLRAIFLDRLYFKYKDGGIAVHHPEVVEQLRAKVEKEAEREALLGRGAENLQRLARGEELAAQWPERDLCLRLVADFYLLGNEAPEAALAREMLKAAGLTRPHDPYHLLVKAGVWQPDENIPLLKSGIGATFGEELLRLAQVEEPTVEELLADPRRRDLTHLPLLTIDGAETRDFDDALHVEKLADGFRVGIHISDVALYVKPGDPIFAEAMRRVTSIYFDDQAVPMLPRALSEGVCSLIAGRPRAAMSFLVELSADGEVRGCEIVPSVVRVERQLTYPQAEGMMEQDEPLRLLRDLSRRLQHRRIRNGAVLLPVPDVVLRIGKDGVPEVSLADVDSPARLLVAEFMVLANTLAAEFVAGRAAPGLFRVQDEPYQRVVQGYQRDLFAIWRQRKQLKPGQLLTVPRYHSGVGVMQYTTVTSPIRRLLDLVMQHQIHQLKRGEGVCFSEQELRGIIGAINTVQPRVNQARRDRHRYWLLKYLEARLGRRLEALVVGKGPRRVNVVLLDCLLEGELPPNQAVGAQPGDTVEVRIARAEPFDGILRLEW